MSTRSVLLMGVSLIVSGCSALASDDSALSAGSTSPPSYTASPVPPALPAEVAPATAGVQAANPFVTVETDPLATFAVDVDSASYDIFRRSLLLQTLPDPATVRIEEFVNYFHYDYRAPGPEDAAPFSINLSASPLLGAGRTKVLRVGIAGAVQEKRATNVVFLVDTSGSMAAENKLPLVQTVLREALTVLDGTDTVSIVTYAGSTAVALAATPARERSKIEGAIARLSSSGGTNGASGIELAYAEANSAFLEDGINHVVLCTDGDFNLGVTDDAALVRLIEQKRQSGVTLTALGVGDRNNDAMMERVSNAGNGIYSVLYNEDQAVAYAHQRLLSSMVHIAKDVKVQVEFNPERVHAYRLMGYEDRLLGDQQFRDDRVDAGEIGSGHQVTALFELALTESDLPADVSLSAGETQAPGAPRAVGPDELARVFVRYKQPGASEADAAEEVVQSLAASELLDSVDELDGDAFWALGVASLAARLRGDASAQSIDLVALEARLAREVGDDAARSELVSMFPQLLTLLAR
jgi:Ca-activated chloride channel homolog